MLRAMTTSVTSFSVTIKTEIGYLQLYRDYCLSCDAIPVSHHPFDYDKVAIYIIFFFLAVDSSASVAKIPSALKFVCQTRGIEWVSRTMASRLSRLVKGLQKLAPHFAKQAAPLSLQLIVAVILELGHQFELGPDDPRRRRGRTHQLWFTQWITRCLCAHSAMLRADDHDHRQQECWKNMVKRLVVFKPSFNEATVVVVWVPPGKCNAKPEPSFHTVAEHIGCFAVWMKRYWLAMGFPDQPGSATLWPTVLGDNIYWDVPHPVKDFVLTTKHLLRMAGVDPVYIDHVTGHSWRCGGLTDYLAAGAPDSFVKLQGRWRSDCYRVYLRYSFAYGNDVSARLFSAIGSFASRWAPAAKESIDSFLRPNYEAPEHKPYVQMYKHLDDDDGI